MEKFEFDMKRIARVCGVEDGVVHRRVARYCDDLTEGIHYIKAPRRKMFSIEGIRLLMRENHDDAISRYTVHAVWEYDKYVTEGTYTELAEKLGLEHGTIKNYTALDRKGVKQKYTFERVGNKMLDNLEKYLEKRRSLKHVVAEKSETK